MAGIVLTERLNTRMTRWKLRAQALCTGLLYAFSQPFVWPGDDAGVLAALKRPAWLLAFFCLVPLLLAVRRMTPRQAYFFSAWTFIPAAWVILYWLIIAMNVFGHIPLLPAALLLVLLCIAAWNFLGTAVGVARLLEVRFRWPAVCAVPICWAGMEWWRAHVYFGGFPWANLGVTQFNNLPLLQLGSLGGTYLIIVVIVAVNVVLYEVVRSWLGEGPFPWRTVTAVLVILVSVYVHGLWRIDAVNAAVEGAPRIRVGMLQGNIEQGIKNRDMQNQEFIVGKFERLQQEALARGAEVVIWPEAAYPAPLHKADTTLSGRRFPDLAGATGIVGATVFWRDPPLWTGDKCKPRPAPAECRPRTYVHNSGVVVTSDRRITGRFDKAHLVPFGEYVPVPFGVIARALVPGLGMAVPGDRLEPLPLSLANGKTANVGGLVCYEGVFPQYARDLANAGAQLLINITNDAWYGISSASVQHLAFYAVRAAETQRAVARVANTGITALVDPAGRIRNPSPLYVDAAPVVDAPLMTHRTLYTMTGDITGGSAAVVFAGALGYGLYRWALERTARRAGSSK
jgi:apolipoprotein N-acyltransferase